MLKKYVRTLLRTYRPFLVFLAKFFGTYAVLTIVYSTYLSKYRDRPVADPITVTVAHQSQTMLSFFGADASLAPQPGKPWLKLYYNKRYVARIIEGCNAISVMILFAAFIVAFAGKIKITVLYILAGFVVIHLLNIGRIALLCAALFNWPQHEHFLHGVVFPLVIYSVVFILWVIWVNRFSHHAKRNT